MSFESPLKVKTACRCMCKGNGAHCSRLSTVITDTSPKYCQKKHFHVNPVWLLPNPTLLFHDSVYRNTVDASFLVKERVNELNTSDSWSIFTWLWTGFTTMKVERFVFLANLKTAKVAYSTTWIFPLQCSYIHWFLLYCWNLFQITWTGTVIKRLTVPLTGNSCTHFTESCKQE